MSPSCSVMSRPTLPSSSSLRLTVIGSGAFSPGFGGCMTSTSLLAFCVGEPASASASSSDIVVPGSVTLPGVRTSPRHEHAARLELIDLDAHLRDSGGSPPSAACVILSCASASERPATGTRLRYGIEIVPSVSTRYLLVRSASSVTMIDRIVLRADDVAFRSRRRPRLAALGRPASGSRSPACRYGRGGGVCGCVTLRRRLRADAETPAPRRRA